MDVNAELLEGGSGVNLGQDRLLSRYLVQIGTNSHAVQSYRTGEGSGA